MVQLSEPGDPLIYGTSIVAHAEDRKPANTHATVPQANKYIPKQQRAISEFPADAHTQTILNVVLLYSLLGMSDNEIAHTIGSEIGQIENLKQLDAYQETFALLHKEMISANSTSLQSRISSYAAQAVDNVMDLAGAKPVIVRDENGNVTEERYNVPPIVVLKANQDILDRSGLAADALFGKDSDSENTLNIVVHQAQDSKSDINVNLNMGKKK